MNKRIRKKQIRRTLIALVTSYEEWERERDEKYRQIAEKYGVSVAVDPKIPFGFPIIRYPAAAPEGVTEP